ncbi:MAG: N-acetyltransferase [Clostridia bacterium]|nr:N-acetyltransferase [Clostridia bacterium]
MSIVLRQARVSDAPALLAIYAPYVEETAISFEYQVPSLAEFEGRILHITAKHPYLVAEENGRILGYAYASVYHGRAAYGWCVETSIYVDRALRGKGIGRLLHDGLERILKNMGVQVMFACIAVPFETENQHVSNASRHFHEKMGYETVAVFNACGYKFNTWVSTVWMEKRLAPPGTPPTAVTLPEYK